MARWLALLLLTVPLLVAGCVQPGPFTAEAQSGPASTGIFAREEPLWHNPQTFPHPAFGFPTLTNPPEDDVAPEWWKPIPERELPAHIDGLQPVASLRPVFRSGAGMTVFGGLAIVPASSGVTHVVDIREPATPKVLSAFSPSTRAVDVIAYPDGRLVGVFATGSGALYVTDLTDPAAPFPITTIHPSRGTHKVNIVPGTPIVYNANSEGGGTFAADPARASGVTEIYDLSDPENPVHVQDWENGYGCHHIYFWLNPAEDKLRAICAGVEVTQIWDIADPRNPQVLVSIPVHHGDRDLPPVSASPVMFSHFSILNKDGTVLVVGDETGGGLAPGCDAHVEAAGASASGPLGNLWFYDVSDETAPRLLGSFSPSSHFLSAPTNLFAGCTAHHGRLVPDPEGRDLLVMAYYGAGVVLVDFTDPSSPKLVDQWNPGTDTWEAQYYRGYVFTGDLSRGLDVLTFR